MLSNLDIPEVIESFDDLDLLGALNDLIFNRQIQNNEQIINKILNIFYNLITKNNKRILEDIIKPGMLTAFFNNLLIKFKNEKVILNYYIEENILYSLHNIIYFYQEETVKYILEKGQEIYNFLIETTQSIFSKSIILSINCFINMLYNLEMFINIEILEEIANSVINALNKDVNIRLFEGINCLYIIIQKCSSQNLSNEFRLFLNKLGTGNLIEKTRIRLINGLEKKKMKKEEELSLNVVIEEINKFLNQD